MITGITTSKHGRLNRLGKQFSYNGVVTCRNVGTWMAFALVLAAVKAALACKKKRRRKTRAADVGEQK